MDGMISVSIFGGPHITIVFENFRNVYAMFYVILKWYSRNTFDFITASSILLEHKTHQMKQIYLHKQKKKNIAWNIMQM